MRRVEGRRNSSIEPGRRNLRTWVRSKRRCPRSLKRVLSVDIKAIIDRRERRGMIWRKRIPVPSWEGCIVFSFGLIFVGAVWILEDTVRKMG